MFHKEHKYTARLLCGAAAGALVMFANIAHAEDLSSIDIASQPLAKALGDNEQKIVDELDSVQGQSVEIDGYYRPDSDKVVAAMRPSETLNEALESFSG